MIQRPSATDSHGSGSLNESNYSRTDTFEKTGYSLTIVNIVKSFVGLGILASPWGFKTTGFIPATILIIVNALLCMVTVKLQVRTR